MHRKIRKYTMTALALAGALTFGFGFWPVKAAGETISGKITVDGESDDWKNVPEQKSTDNEIKWWKAAKDADGNLYFSFGGDAVTQWYGNYQWKWISLPIQNGGFQMANAASSGCTYQAVNTANGNTAGSYTVEVEVPTASLTDPNGSMTFAGTTLNLSDLPVLDGKEDTLEEDDTYKGIVIDGKFNDWNAVTKYDANDPNKCISKAAMVFDGDHVYLYVQDAPGMTAAGAGSHSNGNFQIVTDLGRKAVLRFNYDGTVTSSAFSKIQSRHVGDQWEVALDASQLPTYSKTISFGLYSVDHDDPVDPIVKDVENLHPTDRPDISDGSGITYDGRYDDWKYFPHTEIEYATAGTQETMPDGEGAIYSNGKQIFGHVETQMPEHLNEKGGEMAQAVTIRVNREKEFYPRIVSVDSQGIINWDPSFTMSNGSHEYYLVDTQGWHSAKTLDELNNGKNGNAVYGKMTITVGDQKDECEYYIDAEQLAKKFNMNANDIQYVEERFGRIGQQWIGTSGASTGPWGSVALCTGIACLGWFLKRRVI